jgi:hypothetical protein
MLFDNSLSSRSTILVLGAGRSGTSLVMQILVGMGGFVSNELITANFSNPEGFYEDAIIRDTHVELMDKLLNHPSVPLDQDWINTSAARQALQTIQHLVESRVNSADHIWCLKDPLISSFLPLWFKIFNRLRIIPKYILSFRNPADTVASFIRQYGYSNHLAELVFLIRVTDSLQYTAADCFVMHYEDWFDQPLPLAQSLLHYTGLNKTFKDDLSEVLAQKVKSNLNRASKDDYEIQNPYVKKLYSALQQCRGADFDRDRLMAVVKECRHAMDGFKGWYQLAHQANKNLVDTQRRLEKANVEAAKVKTLEGRIRELEAEKLQNAQWVQQVQKLERQFEQLMAVKIDTK